LRTAKSLDTIAVMEIGIMGAPGSFSEQAAEQYQRTFLDNQSINIKALVNAESVLTAVEEGTVDCGIFPIENSNGGIVIEAVHAMAAHRFSIERIFELDVHHMLLALPGTDPATITTVTSHDQAIKQCRMYLRRNWADAAIEVYADTAKAAADLANGTLAPTTAVIAPRRCAKMYGLDILEESIQDLKFNYTSFLVAVKS
jgi:prephenate dehydratase